VVSMPATCAGIGAAGREGNMDPLEDPPKGEPSRTAMMPNGTTEETPELKEAAACAQVFSTRETSLTGGRVLSNSVNTHASAWSSSNYFRIWKPTDAAARKVWHRPPAGGGCFPSWSRRHRPRRSL